MPFYLLASPDERTRSLFKAINGGGGVAQKASLVRR